MILRFFVFPVGPAGGRRDSSRSMDFLFRSMVWSKSGKFRTFRLSRFSYKKASAIYIPIFPDNYRKSCLHQIQPHSCKVIPFVRPRKHDRQKKYPSGFLLRGILNIRKTGLKTGFQSRINYFLPTLLTMFRLLIRPDSTPASGSIMALIRHGFLEATASSRAAFSSSGVLTR